MERNNRRNDSHGRNDSGQREMFDAVCMKCNKPCKVPFKPTQGKGVSCSDCFVRKSPAGGRGFGGRDSGRGRDNSRGGRGGFSGGRNDSRGGFSGGRDNRRGDGGSREMFDAVCMKCNKPCKVPFKPTQGKGVSCSDCFVRKSPAGGRGGFSGGRDSRSNNRGRR